MIFGWLHYDPDLGETIGDALIRTTAILTLIPGVVVTVLALLPVVRKSLKPKASSAQQASAYPQQHPGAYPQPPGNYHQQ
jgi:UPF0716 family protein affecting phage T7 exclusion